MEKLIHLSKKDCWTSAMASYEKLRKKYKDTDYIVALMGSRQDDGKYHVRVYENIREKPNKNGIIDYNYHGVTDNCELVAPFDGKVYTSKAKMRDEARARDLIEIGNENVDKIQSKKRQEIMAEQRASTRGDIERALHILQSRQ